MNNKNTLYIIIAILVVLNVVTLSVVWGSRIFNPFSSMGWGWSGGLMGRGSMMHDSSDGHDHGTDDFNTWEEMQKHMEEEHRNGGMMHSDVSENNPVAETHDSMHDFGRINTEDGVVSTTFEIENHGRGTLKIGEISTSCGCTSAEVDKTELEFNETANLTVNFDPNFHEEPGGQFKRSVFVKTNDPKLPEMQFDVSVEILN